MLLFLPSEWWQLLLLQSLPQSNDGGLAEYIWIMALLCWFVILSVVRSNTRGLMPLTDGYTSRFLYTLYLIRLCSFIPMMLYIISSVLHSVLTSREIRSLGLHHG